MKKTNSTSQSKLGSEQPPSAQVTKEQGAGPAAGPPPQLCSKALVGPPTAETGGGLGWLL